MDAGLEAVAFAAVIISWFIGGSYFEDKDDVRLDRLRQTAVEACDHRTESTEALTHCVTVTLKATGQKT